MLTTHVWRLPNWTRGFRGAPPALPLGGSACRPPGVGVTEVPTKPRGQRVWCQEADGSAPIARCGRETPGLSESLVSFRRGGPGAPAGVARGGGTPPL